MKTFIVSLVATLLALAVGIIAGRQVNGLQNKAANLPTKPVVIPEAPPPAQQRVVTDFDDPNTLFQPVDPERPKGPLEPADPARKAAAESAATYQRVSQVAYAAAWIIPVVWVIAFYRKVKRAVMRRIEELSHESETHQRDGVLDGGEPAGDSPELHQAGGTEGCLPRILRPVQGESGRLPDSGGTDASATEIKQELEVKP
jgi:hypothetical protein